MKIKISKLHFFEPFFFIYFIWYYLPIVRAVFDSKINNLFFFCFFIAGWLLLFLQYLYDRKKLKLENNIYLPILIYIFVFCILSLFDIADAQEHIRVSFSFWGVILTYIGLSSYTEARCRLTKLCCILFVVTFVTSLIGVINNPDAARILTYASNSKQEDFTLQMANIGGISFFQSLVLLIPICVTGLYKRKYLVINCIIIAMILCAIVFASFTISLIMLGLALFLTVLFNCKSFKSKIFLVVVVVMLLLVFPWVEILTYLSEIIPNERISQRITSIVISNTKDSSLYDISSRFYLYSESFLTFYNHPLGIGPKYSYISFEEGIGYHSQILDDLARYGIFAILFYFFVFKSLTEILKKQWKKLNMVEVVYPIVIVYISFLLLNIGFMSAHESIMLYIIILGLPEMIKKRRV